MTSANVTATFECELSKDGLKVEWYKGDKKLRRDDRYNMSSVGKVHKLVIDKVEADCVGEYSVAFQKLTSSAKLSMEGESILLEGSCCLQEYLMFTVKPGTSQFVAVLIVVS